MKKSKCIALAAILAFTVACKDKKETINTNETTTEQVAEQSAVDFAGVYTGTLPCADCSGIQTELVLRSDKTFSQVSTYEKKGEIGNFVDEGSYTWDADKKVITLDLGDNTTTQYLVENNQLVQLDADGKRIEGELAPNYILSKLTVGDVSGHYFNGEKGKGSYDELTVEAVADNQYKVSVETGGSPKGCHFEATGTLDGNKIKINLAEVQKDMKSNLYVTFSGNEAKIFTDAENNYDLMYFCGGGGSLAGTYTKK
ncbi:copper resistance protein NlpE [Riemerella columbina]|uniref:copper resistance protein NlpE n=1 Tax=Riemerella columbina TaxID=103810 RepID=UPI00266EAD70|nr:copper resistance protein NlpE [Riemerella columbina]WKS94306.1 copper resistance protein NlpE [Riemerella columbina]